jgi:uncharacterized protein (DUF1697 family)
MSVLVALIRGINVGSAKRVKMADLRAALESAGYEDVRTHLQSGNVVLRTGDSAAKVEKAVAAATGLNVDVIVRTGAHIRKVVAENPFPQVVDGKTLHVAFLAGKPEAIDLDPARFAPEAWAVKGHEVYIWLPDGMRDSKLMKALSEKRYGVAATLRNWNTVTALADMAD